MIDEAHNIEKNAEEGYSFVINITNLDIAEVNLRKIFDFLTKNPNNSISFIDIQSILNPLLALKYWMTSIPLNR